MAPFTAKRHTWDFPESVNYTDFFISSFTYIDNHAIHAFPRGITWDGTSFYVTKNVTATVYEYNTAWAEQAQHALHANNTAPTGICWDGTNFYVVDRVDDLVYKYTDAWVYVSTHALHVNNPEPNGITWDGTYFYVVENAGDKVYKYDSSWTYQSDHSLTGANSDAIGICWDGTYFYVTDFIDDLVYKYTDAWVYVSTHGLTGANAAPYGLYWDGNHLFILDLDDALVYEYDDLVTSNTNIAGHNDTIILVDGMYESWAAAHMTGFVEYWFRVEDATTKTNVIFYDATGNECINIYIDAEILIADGSNILDPALDDIFYRIGIDFDCTPNTYDAYLNGALIVNDEAFAVNDDGSGLTGIKIDMETVENGLMDGLGYDWDPDYDQGDNADDTIDITADIKECKIVEEMGIISFCDLKVKGTTITDFEAGHEISFYDEDVVLSWTGRILYPEAVLEGTEIVGKMRLLGLESQFSNVYRKNFTTLRDSDYVIKHIIDNNLTRYHSYDDEIDNFTLTYKYDLKTKIFKMNKYLSMLERAVIHFKPDGEIFFNKYDNLSASGLSWNQNTTKVMITSYTPAANRHVTRAPIIGANNNLGQVYYIGRGTEEEEDQYGINELQVWRDPEITNYTEAKQIGDNLQIIYSLDTQMIKMLVVGKKHIQVGYTIELEWAGVFSITKTDLLVTKRVWYPMIDKCEIDITDNILTRSAFNIRVINKFYDEDAQQSFDEGDVSESTVDGTVLPLTSVAELRAAGVNHTAMITPSTHRDPGGSVWSIVQFDNNYESNSAVVNADAANNRIIAVSAGWYLISATVRRLSYAYAPGSSESVFYKNGVIVPDSHFHSVWEGTTNYYMTSNLTMIANLSANDYIQLYSRDGGIDCYIYNEGTNLTMVKLN